MHLSTHLMMLMLAVVACRAAFIPNMMFSSGRNRQIQQQQPKAFAQQPAWRAAGNPLSPWDDGTETYGYLADRHPNAMDDLTPSYQPQAQQLPQSQQPLVYGVPHRYLSEPLPNSYPMVASPTDELYNNELYNNALLMRGRGPFNSIKRSSLASFYDSSMDDDSVNFDDGLTAMASDYYDQPISHQDVVNFEKYVQRYFQQQPSEAESEAEVDSQYGDYWSNGESEDAESESDDSSNNYDVDNDEEAARQLHLLLNQQKQQRRPIALREIQKKSAPSAGAQSAVKSTPRTEAPVTTATTTTTSSATVAPQSQQGQKEEPLLRPPTPQRQPQPQQQMSSTTTTTTTTPSAAKKDVQEEDGNIYHTIQRLMNMRNRLQKSPGDDIERDWDDENNNRAKRFVAPSPDSLLNKQIHSLDKIRA
ncbi:uncharacterized protein LOC124352500 [Daphnia pulicaria]|uniref:uncharacterized protein LOC124352500 n=1 Tax=Daphnia pulicaria TaxID=35523 RepID=UPI001EEA7A4C|nr:uncharacterized protein LOC124352500 [Daphnia pulicaria]